MVAAATIAAQKEAAYSASQAALKIAEEKKARQVAAERSRKLAAEVEKEEAAAAATLAVKKGADYSAAAAVLKNAEETAAVLTRVEEAAVVLNLAKEEEEKAFSRQMVEERAQQRAVGEEEGAVALKIADEHVLGCSQEEEVGDKTYTTQTKEAGVEVVAKSDEEKVEVEAMAEVADAEVRVGEVVGELGRCVCVCVCYHPKKITTKDRASYDSKKSMFLFMSVFV